MAQNLYFEYQQRKGSYMQIFVIQCGTSVVGGKIKITSQSDGLTLPIPGNSRS